MMDFAATNMCKIHKCLSHVFLARGANWNVWRGFFLSTHCPRPPCPKCVGVLEESRARGCLTLHHPRPPSPGLGWWVSVWEGKGWAFVILKFDVFCFRDSPKEGRGTSLKYASVLGVPTTSWHGIFHEICFVPASNITQTIDWFDCHYLSATKDESLRHRWQLVNALLLVILIHYIE